MSDAAWVILTVVAVLFLLRHSRIRTAIRIRSGRIDPVRGQPRRLGRRRIAEQPGRNVSAKAGLNKSILDQGWFEFRRQLDDKLAWRGGWLVAVPAQNTSRACPCCGHVSADNRQTQAQFGCVECGFEDNADLVGAINIRARGMESGERRAGHARMACG